MRLIELGTVFCKIVFFETSYLFSIIDTFAAVWRRWFIARIYVLKYTVGRHCTTLSSLRYRDSWRKEEIRERGVNDSVGSFVREAVGGACGGEVTGRFFPRVSWRSYIESLRSPTPEMESIARCQGLLNKFFAVLVSAFLKSPRSP